MLSGGAALGLASACMPEFETQHQIKIEANFGAVGAMKAKLLDGAPCDVLILTEALIDELSKAQRIMPSSARSLGWVKTAVAVKSGQAHPKVDDPEVLKAVFLNASSIHFPDPQLATAGIHFMKVLKQMGIEEQVADRLHTYPNGATAMKAMADAQDPRAVGCTQATEILITPGIDHAGDLPKVYELATRYVGAVTSHAAHAQLAEQWLAALADPKRADLRLKMGFLPD